MSSLNSIIDLTYLKPDCTRADIDRLCADAIRYGVYSVCVPPYFAQQAARILEHEAVRLTTVIAFPYGYSTTQVKAEEIKKAVDDNVNEIDVVANIAAIKSGDWSFVNNDVEGIVRLGHMRNLVVKLIIEFNALTQAEIEQICQIAIHKEVDFIKTGTGTFGDPVQPDHIRWLRSLLPDQIKIKASGGIRTIEQARALVDAGAGRLGTSAVAGLLEI